MTIDEITDILFFGDKEKISEILKEQKIKYNFSRDLISHSIESDALLEGVRGGKLIYKPNCIDYFGYEYNYANN